MTNSFRDIQRKTLQRRREALAEEYDAINRQIDMTLAAGDRVRLQRQADRVLQEIEEVDAKLSRLTPSTVQQHRLDQTVTSSEDRPVDFVIGAALEEELDAVLAKLPGFRQLDPSPNDIRIYYAAQVPVTFPSGATGTYEVRVLLLGKGQDEATLAAADAIRRWKPGYMLVVGIAGGVTANGANLGDVLVADQIVGYELQKQTSKRVDVRWNVHQVNKNLVLSARNVRGNDWQQLVMEARPEPGAPQCHIGPIASGNKVIAYGKVVERYRDVWSQLIGVEMEAAGVAAATFQQAQPTRFFMVRSVSDLADEAKDSQEVKRWRAYACDVAAAYAVALLQGGPTALAV